MTSVGPPAVNGMMILIVPDCARAANGAAAAAAIKARLVSMFAISPVAAQPSRRLGYGFNSSRGPPGAAAKWTQTSAGAAAAAGLNRRIGSFQTSRKDF